MRATATTLLALVCSASLFAQSTTTKPQTQTKPPQAPGGGKAVEPTAPLTLPPGYTIGVGDIMTITSDVPLRNTYVGGEVVVRPDGKVSLQMVNDVQAAGITVEEFRQNLVKAFTSVKAEPDITVQVKQINSRFVSILGAVAKSGPYPLLDHMRVSQLIAIAGGLADWAKKDQIVINRLENGKIVSYKYNYNEVSQGKKTSQDIELKPGDTVFVR